ncbi:MAG: MBL fold metallo-hydrolase [Pseudomonadota bacterium]
MLTRVGEIEIWRILDWQGLFFRPERLFPNAPSDVAKIVEALAPGSVDAETGRLILPVLTYLLKTPEHVILIDTGVGDNKTTNGLSFWNHITGTGLPAALAEAGVTPEDIDYVLFTHLHIDHVGWNTQLQDGQYVPMFPKATYLFPAGDQDECMNGDLDKLEESITPIIDAGMATWMASDEGIGDSITLLPTPGHTLGHVSILLRSGGQEAVITGDAIHSTAQCQNPEWQFAFDTDAALAVTSRRRLLETCVERDFTVIGCHFTLPSIGKIEADGDVFRWVGS